MNMVKPDERPSTNASNSVKPMADETLQSVLSRLAEKPTRWWLGYTAIPLLAIALLATQWIPSLSVRRLLVQRMTAQLNRANDTEAASLLARIAELDEPGLPTVTATLGHERTTVSLAAGDVLQRKLDQWTMLPNDQSTLRVTRLAETLAAVAPSLGPNSRARAARLAERMLRWPLDRDHGDGVMLVAHCEQVLQAHQETVAQLSTDRQPETPTPAQEPPTPITNATLSDSPTSTTITLSDAPDSNEASSNVADVGVTESPETDATTTDSAAGPPAIPRISLSDEAAEAGASTGTAVLSPPETGAAPPGANPPNLLPPDSLPPSESLAPLDPPPRLTENELRALQRLPDVEVMRMLHRSESGYAVAAIDELRRRGFQSRHLRLAKRLTDPDPAERRALAFELPGASDVDARPWLDALLDDENAQVRIAAADAIKRLPKTSYRDRIYQRRPRTQAADSSASGNGAIR